VTDQLTWYVARAAGLTAWTLVAASILWGLFLSTGVLRSRAGRPWMLDLHRFLGGLSVSFVAVHLVALTADTYVTFGWRELLVPMASEWRPGAVAWGITALWLLLAIQITSMLRRRVVSERIWRAVHGSSFVLFGTGTVHAIGAGTDVTSPIVAVPLGLVTLGVLGLIWWRVLAPAGDTGGSGRPSHRALQTGTGSTSEVLTARP